MLRDIINEKSNFTSDSSIKNKYELINKPFYGKFNSFDLLNSFLSILSLDTNMLVFKLKD